MLRLLPGPLRENPLDSIQVFMPLTVSDELLQTAHLSEAELMQEIAVTLFQQDRLTLGQAAAFAGLTRLGMQRILASRRIPLHYGSEDLEHDLATVRNRLRA
jgi:predicted HTH domain antitoxin